MSKEQMIAAIRKTNRSANSELLASFDEDSLGEYLQRLNHLLGHRGSCWVRSNSHKAVVARTVR